MKIGTKANNHLTEGKKTCVTTKYLEMGDTQKSKETYETISALFTQLSVEGGSLHFLRSILLLNIFLPRCTKSSITNKNNGKASRGSCEAAQPL